MKNLFSSSATTVIMLCVYAIVLAIATIIEKFYGTAIAKAEVSCSVVSFLSRHISTTFDFRTCCKTLPAVCQIRNVDSSLRLYRYPAWGSCLFSYG